MLKVYSRRYVPEAVWRIFTLNIEFGLTVVFFFFFTYTTWNFLYHFFWRPLFQKWCCISNGFPLWHFFRFFFFFTLSLVFRRLIIMHISMDSFGFTQFKVHHNLLGFPCGSVVKNLLVRQEMLLWSLGLEDPLEEGIATHSSILSWRTWCTEEPSRLQSIESQRG